LATVARKRLPLPPRAERSLDLMLRQYDDAFSFLASTSILKSHVRESLAFFSSDWTVVRRRSDSQASMVPRVISPPAQHTFLSPVSILLFFRLFLNCSDTLCYFSLLFFQILLLIYSSSNSYPFFFFLFHSSHVAFQHGNLVDGDIPDVADVNLIKRYDRHTTDKQNAKLRASQRDDLANLYSVSKADSGTSQHHNSASASSSLSSSMSLSSSSVCWPEHTRGASVRMIEVAVRELRFQLGDLESFFGQLALFDVARKVSQSFGALLFSVLILLIETDSYFGYVSF
jgi:hypothetical protein